MDGGTFRHGEARIVLWEDFTEQLHRLEELWGAELLVADAKYGVIDEGLVQRRAGCVIDGLTQIDAADLGPGVSGQRM